MPSTEVRALTRRDWPVYEKPRDGKPLPAAFAWTGTRPLFEARGFEVAGNRDGAKQRVRRSLHGK